MSEPKAFLSLICLKGGSDRRVSLVHLDINLQFAVQVKHWLELSREMSGCWEDRGLIFYAL